MPFDPVHVREMKMSDWKTVLNLWEHTPGMGLNNLDDSEEGIARFLGRNPTTCFLAEDGDGMVIGTILCGHDGRRGYIYHTAVLPGHRNKGIGQRLVDASIQALVKEGIKKVALVVFKENDIGNAFWEHCGFGVRGDLIYRNKVISHDRMVSVKVPEDHPEPFSDL